MRPTFFQSCIWIFMQYNFNHANNEKIWNILVENWNQAAASNYVVSRHFIGTLMLQRMLSHHDACIHHLNTKLYLLGSLGLFVTPMHIKAK